MISTRSLSAVATASAVALMVSAPTASAQLPTTVQLPSFSYFSYSGTVVVPDRGTAHLGGVNSSATSLNRRGLSRGFGASGLSSGASVSATIIDHREIDRRLLGGSPSEFIKRQGTANRIDPTEEGKSLVRHARSLYRQGERDAAFDTYRMAIDILPGRLRDLASEEFKRVFGSSATQALRMSRLRR